ncbi:MAG: hypothetical protein QM503_01915 [Bacteroidota bacterium]
MTLLILVNLSSFAQNEPIEENTTWNFVAAPYIAIPFIKGDVVAKGIPTEVVANPSDIFSSLNWGTMLYFETANPKWAFTFNGVYMSFSEKGETLLGREVKVDMDQLVITATGMYRLLPWAEIGIGGRLNSLGTIIRVPVGEILPRIDISQTQTWFDPLIVARFMTRSNDDKWRLGLLTDIGGFGVGSDLAWQIFPFAGYQFSKLFEINVAYRWMGTNYETGFGTTDYFVYDVVNSGPEIGFLFHF